MSGGITELVLDGVEIKTARSVRLDREPIELWKLTVEFYLGALQIEQIRNGTRVTAVTITEHSRAIEKRVEELRDAQFKAFKE